MGNSMDNMMNFNMKNDIKNAMENGRNRQSGSGHGKRAWRKAMALLLVLAFAIALAGCGGKKNDSLHGEYHTEANGHKRGIDLDVTMDGENIRAIILDDMDSEYTLTDPDAFQRMWPAKVTGIIQNLQNMGPDEINKIEVELDENGIPTAVNGIPQEWIPDGCIDCAGMLILGVQNALAQR